MTTITTSTTLSKLLPSTTIIESDIDKGVDRLLGLFEQVGQTLFPRKIMTSLTHGTIVVSSKDEMMCRFKEANYVDLRINGYPFISIDDDNVLVSPNIIFIDIDIDWSKKTGQKIARQYTQKTLDNILYYCSSSSGSLDSVLKIWSGNGYHIYLALKKKCLPFPLEHIKEYYDIVANNNIDDVLKYSSLNLSLNQNAISREFLIYAKKKLSNDKADTKNNPSFKSCFLRVPNSINSKAHDKSRCVVKEESVITAATVAAKSAKESSEGTPKDIALLLSGYMTYLNVLKIEHEEIYSNDNNNKNKHHYYNNNNNNNRSDSSNTIYWIETLLQMQLDDHRKFSVDLILVPYFVNIKHLSDYETITKINEWLAKCDKVKPLDSNVNFDYKIRYQINKCKSDRNLKPVRFEETLSKINPDLYRIIKHKITLHSGVDLD